MLVLGCSGEDGESSAATSDATSDNGGLDEALIPPSAEPPPNGIDVDTACVRFADDSERPGSMQFVADNLVDDALAAEFQELAAALRDAQNATGRSLLDARERARDAAAAIDEIC